LNDPGYWARRPERQPGQERRSGSPHYTLNPSLRARVKAGDRSKSVPWFMASLMLALLALTGPGGATRIGPDGKIRTICFGDIIDQTGGYNSFVIIRDDPSIETTFVPTRPDYLGGMESALRNMRVYMPRTYDALVDSFDMILSSDADRSVFTATWIGWITDSVRDDGLGILWLGSIAHDSFVSWEDTTVTEILPCRQVVTSLGEFWIHNRFLKVKISRPEEPLMKALPWEKSPPLGNLNLQSPKPGSEVWARVDERDHPLISFRSVEDGAALNFASKFPGGVSRWASDWDFFPQAMMYLVYRVAEKELPDDPYLFRSAITGFLEFNEYNSLLLSLISWVEQFGGSSAALSEGMEELQVARMDAYAHYLEGDMQSTIDALQEARGEQISIREEAMRAKDRAMLWIYVIEWLVLMATLMVSGFAVWTLMVRRRLYREVGASRLSRR